MSRIALVNMPFTKLRMPALGLTQLRAALEARLEPAPRVDVCYLNHDFGSFFGTEVYSFFTDSKEASNAGLGDWFFRQAAFPELPDNSDEYFRRYFPLRHPKLDALESLIREKRAALLAFFDRLIADYELDRADMVGLTSMFAQHVACLALARIIKQKNPRVVIAMGGANCEAPMGEVIARKSPFVDFVFSGPALKSLPELVEHLRRGNGGRVPAIRGVFARTASRLSVVSAAELGEDLDINEPLELDYSSFFDSLAARFAGQELYPSVLFETSRGCWWGELAHCTFCGLNGSTMAARTMSPEVARRQFASLFRFAGRAPFFDCVDNIMPRNYPAEVFAELSVPENISIFYEIKANVSDEELAILSRNKVNRIQPGIESLATSTLKLMRKGSTAFQNLALLESCVRHRIQPIWNLLIGFPGEGEEVYRKYLRDLPLLVHLPPPTGVFPVRFDRFSPYFMNAHEYGLDLVPLDYYSMIYPWDARDLEQLAYYFRDRNLSAPYFLEMTRWYDRIRSLTDHWAARWRSGDARPFPRLFLQGKQIYDSRSGKIETFELPDDEARVLRALAKPATIGAVAAQLEGITSAEAAIAGLVSRGLVFEEAGRYASLAAEYEPPAKSWLIH